MHSETPQLQPIAPTYHLRILSDEQLDQFKSATLEILEDVGIHCPSEKALNIYAEHGAQVDFESQIVKLPPEVVWRPCLTRRASTPWARAHRPTT